MKHLALILALLLAPVYAYAQNPVRTQPRGNANITNSSTTVSITNTFQSLWAANTQRVGCTIQNNGSNTMYVYFGPIAGALTTNSVKLAVGQSVNCSDVGGTVLGTQVSITGTSGEAFYATQY